MRHLSRLVDAVRKGLENRQPAMCGNWSKPATSCPVSAEAALAKEYAETSWNGWLKGVGAGAYRSGGRYHPAIIRHRLTGSFKGVRESDQIGGGGLLLRAAAYTPRNNDVREAS